MIPMRTMSVKEVGSVPRRLRKQVNAYNKQSWYDTGEAFHRDRRDLRFTHEHGRKARYKKRKGENLARGSKAYRRSYTGRKEDRFGHTRPMEFSRRTRIAINTAKSIKSTSKGVNVRYSGARVLNFRNRFSQIRPSEEFRRFTATDERMMIRAKDRSFQKQLKNDRTTAHINL